MGVVALFVVGGSAWNVASTPDPPDRRDREVVRQELGQIEGLKPVLPVTLPLGYAYARDYDYSTVETDSVSLDETTVRSASWSVSFFPKDGASEDGLPVVVFCVQDPDSRDEFCPEQVDATHLERRHGQIYVAIYRASPGSRDMAAWSAVELTTDLDRVTWLH